MQADNLVDCTVLIGACCDSVFVRNCTGCTFAIACKQLRTRECFGCTFYLLCNTEPVIELSSGLQFAPFHAAWPELRDSLASATIDPANNLWFAVHDFSDDASTPQEGGKNWRRLAESEEAPRWLPSGPCPEEAAVPRIEAFSVPIPSQVEAKEAAATAGGASTAEGGGSSSGTVAFKLGTSQAEADAAFAAAQAKRAPTNTATAASADATTDASAETITNEAAPVDPCTPPLPPPLPPHDPLGTAQGMLLPPISPLSTPVSSPSRARDASGVHGDVAAGGTDSDVVAMSSSSSVEVRFLFTPGDAYEGEPSAMFHKAVASTPADLADLVQWGAVSEEPSEAEGDPVKVCVRCQFTTHPSPPEGAPMRAATGEALRPTALWHALLAACLEPEPTSGAHLVAWIEMLTDHAPESSPSEAEANGTANTGVGHANADASAGAAAGAAAPEVVVAEPKESSGHFFAGVNTQKLALLAAPPVLAPTSPARASARASPAGQSPAVAAASNSTTNNLDAAVTSDTESQKKGETNKGKNNEGTVVDSTDAAVDLVDEITLSPSSEGASAEPITTATMELAAAEHQNLQADLAVLNTMRVEDTDNVENNNKGDGDLTPEVSSGDEADSSGNNSTGNGSRSNGDGTDGNQSAEAQIVPMGSPAHGTVEEVSVLNSSADFEEEGAAAVSEADGDDNEDGGEDESGRDEGSERAADVEGGDQTSDPEVDKVEESEEKEKSLDIEEEYEEEEGEDEEEKVADQSSGGELAVNYDYRAANERRQSVGSDKQQALVRRAQQHDSMKQAGPAVIKPQTLVKFIFVIRFRPCSRFLISWLRQFSLVFSSILCSASILHDATSFPSRISASHLFPLQIYLFFSLFCYSVLNPRPRRSSSLRCSALLTPCASRRSTPQTTPNLAQLALAAAARAAVQAEAATATRAWTPAESHELACGTGFELWCVWLLVGA